MELSIRASKARLVNEASIPDYLKCSSCSNLLINGFQTTHGCRLCQQCVIGKLLPEERRLCPCSSSSSCRDESEIRELFVSQTTCCPDTSTRHEVAELMVHCINSDVGCRGQLKWKHMDSHLAKECEFEIETCNLCSEQIVHYKMHINHKNLQSDDCCLKFSAFCPLCGDTSRQLSRAEFVNHLNICPEKQTKCKYVSIGCQAEVKRSELEEHYSGTTDGHLEMTLKEFKRTIELKDEKHDKLEQTVRRLQFANDQKDRLLIEMQEKLSKLQTRLDNLDGLHRLASSKRLQKASIDDANIGKMRRLSVPSLMPLRESGTNQPIVTFGSSQRAASNVRSHPVIDEEAEGVENKRRQFTGRSGRRGSLQ